MSSGDCDNGDCLDAEVLYLARIQALTARIAELENLLSRIVKACKENPEVAEELFLGCLHDEIVSEEIP